MKTKVLLTTMLIAVTSLLYAQDDEVRTIFKQGEANWGGQFMIYGTGASFNDMFFGGGGFEIGAIRNHQIEFGAFLDFFGSETHTDYKITADDKYFLGGGYGGVYIKPIILSNAPVHFAIPIRIGGGTVGYYSSDYFWEDDYHHNHSHFYNDEEDETGVFVFEPGVNIELNMLKHFRIDLGVSYRMFGSLSLDYRHNGGPIIDNKDLDGLIYSIGFSFGFY